MTHPREDYEFIEFFEVIADLPTEIHRHIAFFTTQKLAEDFLQKWTKDWGPEVIYTNPTWRRCHAITRIPDVIN